MAEKVGKYEIVERIGRGGMGLVFKAHDPVLDRFVAVKVISTEADVTDELRARFFREAQACARLSHPNIVTVYDMGEDHGRLYFVMELLEGEEVRRLIAQKAPLRLEEKLAILVQVCDGLHYAHQRGIVHRDIKPGNIMLLRNGQVKILDFGIAQIATTEGGLTRTGLIMGTLRYIAPEQVRGRADHRADMYSVGAVAYELLSLRPPFVGDDPMHLLEQLRTETPTPLNEVDPNIPPELAAIVDRAMRKLPEERFADLGEMRTELEHVQRGFVQAAQQARAQLRGQREQLVQLQAALAERIGPPSEDPTVATVDDRARLATMRALESDFASRIESLQTKIRQAEALRPALQRGIQLLEAGQAADAAVEFEAIVAEMPDHRRALELLRQAREQAEGQRRQQIAAQFLREAQVAFNEGEFSLCLEILKQAADASTPTEAAPEFGELLQRAERALAAQEATRRLREQADRAREEATRKRSRARSVGAAQHAADLWRTAEAKLAEAQTAFDRQAYASALELFNEVGALYGRVEEAVREGQRRERRRAEEAQERAAQGQRSAMELEADRLARALWGEATAKSADAQAAYSQEQYARAAEAFEAALVLYRRAEYQARDARQRQQQQADGKRQATAERRRSAEAVGASAHAPMEWTEAQASLAAGEAAFAREAYEEAGRAFEAATDLLRRAEQRAREVVSAREAGRADAEKGRQSATRARGAASDAQAAKYAPQSWTSGQSAEAQASAALEREDYTTAGSLYGEARRHYAAAAQAAGVAVEAETRRLEAMMADARRLLESGDVTACMRRVGEALTLRPRHPAAELLRREAEGRPRPAPAEALDSPTVVTDLTVLAVPPAAPPVTPTTSPPSTAAVPTVRIAAPPPKMPAAPPVPPPPVVAETKATSAEAVPDDATVVARRAPFSRSAAKLPAVARGSETRTIELPGRSAATEPLGTKRRPWPLIATVAAACLAFALGGFFWMRRPTPPETPSTAQVSPAPPAPVAPVAPVAPARPPARVTEAPPAPASTEVTGKTGREGASARAPEAPKAESSRADDEARRQLAQRESAARAAQGRVAEARRVAEAADAPRLAAPLWAKAGAAQQKADDAFKQQAFDRAQSQFADAEKGYRAAEKAATEKAAAERATAQKADQERTAALERERAAALQRQLAEATAKQDAEARQRQVAILKSAADDSRSRMLARREQAVKVDADRFAKDLFDAANAKQIEADGFARNENFAAANRGYQDAADGYMEAMHRARGVGEAKAQADRAKAQMLSEKQRANSAAIEFGAAVEEEKQGNALYDKLAFKDAADKYRSAEMLFTRAASAPPKPAPPARAPARPPRNIPVGPS